MPTTPLSLIDFCNGYADESSGESIARSVRFAQQAEKLGYRRIWYSEHHNMPTIISSSPAVLIAHIGAHTEKIRLGAGGVMLPNHAPYVVAEQFGTLEEMYPGRIDLGLGRAPGTDQNTLGRSLRRHPNSAERFPEDIAELNGYLQGNSLIPGVEAVPGAGTNVPLYVLGSSMFGASLAAKEGLPYSFASHFAPQMLTQATSYYRENYQPSKAHPEPYLISAVNVVIADSDEEAQERFEQVARNRVRNVAARGPLGGRDLSEAELDQLLNSPSGQQVVGMLHYTAVGAPDTVRAYLEEFRETSQADELIAAVLTPDGQHTDRSLELLSGAWGLS